MLSRRKVTKTSHAAAATSTCHSPSLYFLCLLSIYIPTHHLILRIILIQVVMLETTRWLEELHKVKTRMAQKYLCYSTFLLSKKEAHLTTMHKDHKPTCRLHVIKLLFFLFLYFSYSFSLHVAPGPSSFHVGFWISRAGPPRIVESPCGLFYPLA